MTATELLATLGRQGIRLRAVGEKLRCSPRSAITPALLAELQRLKPALLATLNGVDETLVDETPEFLGNREVLSTVDSVDSVDTSRLAGPPAPRIVDPWDSPRRPIPTPRLPAGSPLPPECEQHAPPVLRPTLGGPRPFCPVCGRNLRPQGVDPWGSPN